MISKLSHTDWFDNDETNSNTSLDEANIDTKMKVINRVLSRNQTSSDSDTDTSEDMNNPKSLVIKGKSIHIILSFTASFEKSKYYIVTEVTNSP